MVFSTLESLESLPLFFSPELIRFGAEPKSPVNEFYTTISYLSYLGMRDTIAGLILGLKFRF